MTSQPGDRQLVLTLGRKRSCKPPAGCLEVNPILHSRYRKRVASPTAPMCHSIEKWCYRARAHSTCKTKCLIFQNPYLTQKCQSFLPVSEAHLWKHLLSLLLLLPFPFLVVALPPSLLLFHPTKNLLAPAQPNHISPPFSLNPYSNPPSLAIHLD